MPLAEPVGEDWSPPSHVHGPERVIKVPAGRDHPVVQREHDGEIPNVDFLHLYGPGGLWVLAGLFKVFGTDLVVERIWGFLQIAGVVFGVYFLARRWGRRVALTCGLLSLIVILPPLGYAALAWTGGVAFAVLGLLAALAARDRAEPNVREAGIPPSSEAWPERPGAEGAMSGKLVDGRARGLAILAGVLLGAALLYRIDLVVAVGLAVAVVTWKAPRRFVVPLLTALAITTAIRTKETPPAT